MSNSHEMIRLGMYVNELNRLQEKYGYWLQNAEVFSIAQTEPIAFVGAGGGEYSVRLNEEG